VLPFRANARADAQRAEPLALSKEYYDAGELLGGVACLSIGDTFLFIGIT
jgi:hypothetical protein